MALVFTIRAKKTYFLDSVFFIAAANVGFILFLSDTTTSDLLNKPPSPYLDTIFLAWTAISIGFASYLLKESQGKGGFTELTRFMKKPPKALLVFLIISIGWATAALIWQPFSVNSLMTNGEYIYYLSYQTWFQAVSSSTEDDTVVLYNTESDRKRLVERFVDDGIATGQELIFYVIKSEVPFYRAILKGTRMDHARLRGPQMTIQSIDFGAGEM